MMCYTHADSILYGLVIVSNIIIFEYECSCLKIRTLYPSIHLPYYYTNGGEISFPHIFQSASVFILHISNKLYA